MASRMHKEPEALITRKETWQDYCLLEFQAEKMAAEAQPGQFVMVRPSDDLHPLLRRPISIHWVSDGRVEIYFQQAGVGTRLLAQKKKGGTLDILGPLGKGFSLNELLREKPVALVGGGRGIAPLYFLARRLHSLGSLPRIYYGGRTMKDIPLREKFRQEKFAIFLSTDDGSLGYKGLVTDIFRRSLNDFSPAHIFGCGPEAMMQELSRIALEQNIPAEFSLESIMGCGFGACWGCVRKFSNGSDEEWTKICEEGPVFPAEKIIWREEKG
jgi:dihydroorotate dehydrogenase electron transfer subunit